MFEIISGNIWDIVTFTGLFLAIIAMFLWEFKKVVDEYRDTIKRKDLEIRGLREDLYKGALYCLDHEDMTNPSDVANNIRYALEKEHHSTVLNILTNGGTHNHLLCPTCILLEQTKKENE